MNGTIDHRPDRPSKPYRARYLAPDGSQPSKTFKLKRDAETWLRTEIAKIDTHTWTDPRGGARSYGDYAEEWLAGLVGIKPKTRLGYEGLLRSRVLPRFADHQLRRIDSPAVRAWIASMADESLSPSRIRQARQVLGASLQQAVDDGLIGRNPVKGVKVPTEHHREMKFLTARQLHELANIAERHQPGAGVLITFLGLTGLRWSEAVALKRSSLDLFRRRVHVTESTTDVGGRLITGRPKNHRVRAVVLPRSLVDALAAHLAPGEPDERVFCAPQRGPLRHSAFRKKVWLPAVAELANRYPELDGLRVHDLRHTAASLAISCSANIKVVQRMLGHKTASVTLDRYGHLYTEDLENLADALDEKYRGAA